MKSTMSKEAISRFDVALQAVSALIHSIEQFSNCSSCLSTFSYETKVIKKFNDDKSLKFKIDRLKAEGSTYLSPSLLCGVKSLAAVNSKYNRKVMIFITDGKPSDYLEATDYIERIKKSGVEVYAFGVGLQEKSTEIMEKMFKGKFVNFNDPEKLQEEIVKIAKLIM